MSSIIASFQAAKAREAVMPESLTKQFWRIRWYSIPVLCIYYCISWLDRVIAGFTVGIPMIACLIAISLFQATRALPANAARAGAAN